MMALFVRKAHDAKAIVQIGGGRKAQHDVLQC